MAYKDPDVGRLLDRERFARRTAERRAASLCPRCGERRPAPGRSICEPCAGRDAERCRRIARSRSRRRDQARKAAGQCTRCGKQHPVEGGAVCEPCREMRRVSEQEQYARAAYRR